MLDVLGAPANGTIQDAWVSAEDGRREVKRLKGAAVQMGSDVVPAPLCSLGSVADGGSNSSGIQRLSVPRPECHP